MQGHSWTNPDDQRMLQALQSKPDMAYTLPILWQVSIWNLEPMQNKAKSFSLLLFIVPLSFFEFLAPS